VKSTSQFSEIYIYRHPVDMRKYRNGLCAVVHAEMGVASFGKALFIFTNKKETSSDLFTGTTPVLLCGQKLWSGKSTAGQNICLKIRRLVLIICNLPRERIEHDLSEEEKFCSLHNISLVKIGEDVSEQLEIVPEQIKVLQHVRPKTSVPAAKVVSNNSLRLFEQSLDQ